MRILSVASFPGFGGAEKAARSFRVGYQELGHDSKLVYMSTNTSLADPKALPPGEFFLTDVLDGVVEPPLVGAWIPDLIHLHTHDLSSLNVQTVLKAFGGFPTVVETNVFAVPSPWESELTASFQLSPWARTLYIERGGEAAKALVVPNPLHITVAAESKHEARVELGLPTTAAVIGRVGQPAQASWSPLYTGVLKEIAANRDIVFLALSPPDWVRKDLEGTKEFKSVLLPQTEDSRLIKNIYGAMDVMLHITEYGESFGYVLLEAASNHRPVVTLATPWRHNSQSLLVNNGQTGFVVNRRRNLAGATLEALDRDWYGADFDAAVSPFARRRVAGLALKAIKDMNVSVSKPTATTSYNAFDAPTKLIGVLKGKIWRPWLEWLSGNASIPLLRLKMKKLWQKSGNWLWRSPT